MHGNRVSFPKAIANINCLLVVHLNHYNRCVQHDVNRRWQMRQLHFSCRLVNQHHYFRFGLYCWRCLSLSRCRGRTCRVKGRWQHSSLLPVVGNRVLDPSCPRCVVALAYHEGIFPCLASLLVGPSWLERWQVRYIGFLVQQVGVFLRQLLHVGVGPYFHCYLFFLGGGIVRAWGLRNASFYLLLH